MRTELLSSCGTIIHLLAGVRVTVARYLVTYLLVSAAGAASATMITFDVASLGGGRFRYSYQIENDGSLGAGVAIEGVAIDFDPALYDETSLQISSDAALGSEWSQTVFFSLPALPAIFDAMALGGGIADGALLSGFAVDFFWLGPGSPGPQSYLIYDPITFDSIEYGITVANAPPPSPDGTVPEPGTLALCIVALGALPRLAVRRSYKAGDRGKALAIGMAVRAWLAGKHYGGLR